MDGLISLLDSQHYKLVESIWNELEKECGLAGVKVTPYPHFSWQIGAEYAGQQTEQAIKAVAGQMRRFTVYTAGLGIFSGPNPVVYIPIIRNPKLNRLHAKLWKQLQPSAKGLSPFYSPQKWMPHITIIFENENARSVLCGLEMLTFRSFAWEIEVNNISYASQSDGQITTLKYCHDLLPR
ncbi:MAG: 2'-5' RNA ligase family protein [Anaerolineales bacterium]